jgi:glycosyltransferase-like protein
VKIALLTYSTRPRGGVVHTLALAEALARLGATVDVWSLARGGDTRFFRPVDPAVGIRLVPFADVAGESVGERVQRSIAALGAAFTPARYDTIHAQDCISANAVPGALRTVHHLEQFSTPELVACHERALRTPQAHLCVSAAVARELKDGWGIEAPVIPNGVDAGRFAHAAGPAGADQRQQWREKLGPYVLAVGGIEPRKGTLDLIDAMAIVHADRPDLRLVIAGGETLFDYREYRAQVEQRCTERNIEPIILGPVDHDELPALVAAAESFAFPSTKEGFGLAAMEALAAGVPVTVRELPVLREVFAGAVRFARTPDELAAGLVAPPDPALRAAGRILADSHTWEAAARRHLEWYETQRNRVKWTG